MPLSAVEGGIEVVATKVGAACAFAMVGWKVVDCTMSGNSIGREKQWAWALLGWLMRKPREVRDGADGISLAKKTVSGDGGMFAEMLRRVCSRIIKGGSVSEELA